MSGRRGDTDSPHCGGQAVARAAKIPRSVRAGRMADLLISLALSPLLNRLLLHGHAAEPAQAGKLQLSSECPLRDSAPM